MFANLTRAMHIIVQFASRSIASETALTGKEKTSNGGDLLATSLCFPSHSHSFIEDIEYCGDGCYH